jgi:hypothetical protein
MGVVLLIAHLNVASVFERIDSLLGAALSLELVSLKIRGKFFFSALLILISS